MCVDRRNLKGSRHGTTAFGQGSSAPVTGVVCSADGSRRATLVSTNESRRRESPAGAREPSAPEAALVRRLPPSHHSETKRVDSPVDCPRVGPGSNSVCRQGIRSSSGPQREVGPRVRPGTHGSKSTPLLYQCFLTDFTRPHTTTCALGARGYHPRVTLTEGASAACGERAFRR